MKILFCFVIPLNQIVIMMFAKSERINCLIKNIVYFTKKSRRTTTPKPFNNPRLSTLGILTTKPRSYDYQLPETLPNRHLYWNRAEQNKLARKRLSESRLYKLQINPIHDENGKRVFNREFSELVAELGSLNLIKQSVGRTLENLHQAIVRFPKEFIGQKDENNNYTGSERQVLLFALNQLHDRHVPTMNLYKFSSYCQLRFMACLEPTDALLLHFFRHLEAMKENESGRIPLPRLAKMSRYFFSRKYSQETFQIFYKKQVKFELFSVLDPEIKTFEDIVPYLYTPEQISQYSASTSKEDMEKYAKWIRKMPGGKQLIAKLAESQ